MISYEQKMCELVKIKTYLTREISSPGSEIITQLNLTQWLHFQQYLQ